MEVRESSRFADYFAVCGVSRSLDLADAKAAPGNPLTSRYRGITRLSLSTLFET